MTITPIFEMLENYRQKRRISFAMPGHKGGEGLGNRAGVFSMDVTELPDTDNLYAAGGTAAKAREKAAAFFGAQETFFLTNGATGGIYTMLAAVCRRGDKVLINRGCHGSVINACIMLGLVPVFAEHELIADFSVLNSVQASEIAERIDDSVRAILVTSPNFYGVCADVRKIAEIAHEYGIPLLVDEAHGAHFAADPTLFPATALQCGADLVVQSAHKTLNAVNQTAYLHINSRLVDQERLRDCVQMLHTSSPSYVMAGFLDSARAELEEPNNWKSVYAACIRLKDEIVRQTQIKTLTSAVNDVFAMDETRVVLNFSAYETTGFAVSDILRTEYNMDIEMADLYNIVCIVTAANTTVEIESLGRAVQKIAEKLPPRKTQLLSLGIPRTRAEILPSQAFDRDGEWILLNEAAGRTAKRMVTVYPPGIPVLFPGAKITAEAVQYLYTYREAGGEIIGMRDDKLYTVK